MHWAEPVALISEAKVGTKKIPTFAKSKIGIIIRVLEFLLEFYNDLIPSFTIKNSATAYCCL